MSLLSWKQKKQKQKQKQKQKKQKDLKKKNHHFDVLVNQEGVTWHFF